MRQEITDCVQMTLDDWMEMKRKLQRELIGVKQSFVRIGFALRKIEDGKLYERDGYKSIAEFAKEEYGLEASTVSRFMSINREYSVDGYSEVLRPEYEKLGRSQLEEMLKLPEGDRAMVRPETSREDIRELKRFNKAEPVRGVADDVDKLVESFYKDDAGALNEVFAGWGDGEGNAKRVAEVVNPSGNRSYQKGLFFLMMYENKISVKKFGKVPTDMTWEEFAKRTWDVFGETFEGLEAGGDLWKTYFGNGTDEWETERKEQEAERKGQEAEQIPGQTTAYDFPEMLPKGSEEYRETLPKSSTETEAAEGRQDGEEATEGQRAGEKATEGQQDAKEVQEERPESEEVNLEEAETGEEESEEEESREERIAPAQNAVEENGVENAYETRKEYMDKLTAEEMAAYIVEEREAGRLGGDTLWIVSKMLKWLQQEVDGSGREIESVEDGNDGEL